MNTNVGVEERDVDMLVDRASNIIDSTINKINCELIIMYWNIGKLVNDYKKINNSKYGDSVILEFMEKLTMKYGKRFCRRNIYNMCSFNNKFEIVQAPAQSINDKVTGKIEIVITSQQSISWDHYIQLLNIDDKEEVNYYLIEISNGRRSTRYLKEQKKNSAYKRLICTQKASSNVAIEKMLKDPLLVPAKKISSEKK